MSHIKSWYTCGGGLHWQRSLRIMVAILKSKGGKHCLETNILRLVKTLAKLQRPRAVGEPRAEPLVSTNVSDARPCSLNLHARGTCLRERICAKSARTEMASHSRFML